MKIKRTLMASFLCVVFLSQNVIASETLIDSYSSNVDGEFILGSFTTNYPSTKIYYDIDLSGADLPRWSFLLTVLQSYKVPETLDELDQMDANDEIDFITGVSIDEHSSKEGYITFPDKGTFWIYLSTGFNNYDNHAWYLQIKGSSEAISTPTTTEDDEPLTREETIAAIITAVLIYGGITAAIVIYIIRKKKNKL